MTYIVASLYKKQFGGRTYWYLRQMARVDGKPKMVSERYVGTAADIEALLEGREQAMVPGRTRHLGFGDLAAVWGLLDELGVAEVIDEVAGPAPAGQPLSTGTYLALATANRVVAPCSKLAFRDWWASTAGDRFTRIPASALDHRRFWDAMHAMPIEKLSEVESRLAAGMIEKFGLDTSSVALDMTNFATFIDTGNTRAPIAQRGKAKQKRADLRLVGLGLVVTRAGGIPLVAHAYPGNKPDVTQFAGMINTLAARYAALPAADPGGTTADMTVVFDAGQNSAANFATLAQSKLGYVGSVPASNCPDLLALPAKVRAVVDAERFGALSAYETRRAVLGATRRTILTHSPELHEHQVRGFVGTTLAKATRQLDELAATLARGKTRRPRGTVEAVITDITKNPWVREVINWHLTGDTPADLRLTWTIDADAQARLEERIFGKHVLITDRDNWSVADVIAAYRSQSEAESSFRQMKDTHVVSFSPMHHFTDHNIRVHTFTCVLALQAAHLMRLQAERAGLHLSVREILRNLAGIGETVLLYQGDRGRPKARRMLTDTDPIQNQLADLYHLDRWAPPPAKPPADSSHHQTR